MPDLAGKSILVTGGAGFIGSHLVDSLCLERLQELVVVDNLFLGRTENLEQARAAFPQLRFYQADASDMTAMEDICRQHQVEVAFNLATIPLPKSLEDPKFAWEVNVALASTWCELARLGHIRTLVNFSSSEVYGTAQREVMQEDHPCLPLTPYAASKLAGDHLVQSYIATFGIDACTVRPFNNFGPRQNDRAYAGIIPKVIKQLLAGEQVTVDGDGMQSRDFIYVGDTAHWTLECYKNQATRGKTLNLGSGRETTILGLVRALFAIMGKDPAEISFGPPRPGDVHRHLAGVDLAQRLLGFAPKVSLEQGLELTVEWYRRGVR